MKRATLKHFSFDVTPLNNMHEFRVMINVNGHVHGITRMVEIPTHKSELEVFIKSAVDELSVLIEEEER